MKLKTKFTLIVSSLVVAILALTAFLAFAHYKKSIKEIISQQQFLMISTFADAIDNQLLTAQQHVVTLAKATPPDIMRSPEKAQAFLDNKPDTHLMFDNHLFLFTPAGKIFVESPYAPGRRGLDLSFREYITNTLKTGKPYISDPFISSQPHKHPVIMLTAPLFNSKGDITGILAGSIDLMKTNFMERISTVKVGKTGNFYLYKTDGTMIMHPNKKRILVKMPRGLNRLYDMARDGFEGTGETTTSYGMRAVSSFKRLKAKNWILAANYPQAEAYLPIRKAEQYFLIGTVAGVIAVFFIISFTIRALINPLELFTRHVQELPQKTGDDRLLRLNTDDEIGMLSSAFNNMVAEIDRDIIERTKATTILRNLAAYLQSIREEDRTNIAREIHDELGQALTALKMEISWFRDNYGDHKQIFEKTDGILRTLNETILSVKRICTELRPSLLDDFGLIAAMEWQANEFQKRTEIECSVAAEPEVIELDKERSTVFFRIFQEALTNVLKHANATKVTARLTQSSNRIILEVVDNGIGITDEQLSKPQSFGLIGMRERAYPWGGEVEVTGNASGGTTIKVIIPRVT